MLLNDSKRTLIQNLKGRISKVLGGSTKLKKEERAGLENICYTIDEILLYNGSNPKTDGNELRVSLLTHAAVVGDTDVKYIKAHILPMINKITTDKWESK